MAVFFRNLPFFAVLLFVAGAAMLAPVLVGYVVGAFETARLFLYCSALVLTISVMIGFATQSRKRTASERSHLATLFLAYLWLPVVLAIPMDMAVGNTRFINVYFDMVSALTTTGAQVFEPARLDAPVHLWRGIVGWLGGLVIWITAVAVLAPLNLGGYEVTSEANIQGAVLPSAGRFQSVNAGDRLRKYAVRLVPVYLGLTVILGMALTAAGEAPLIAAVHAMSTLATSGISPVASMKGGSGGVPGEMLIFLFLIFAVSRRTFANGFSLDWPQRIARDREVRLAGFAIAVLPALLFARHWIAAFEVDELANAEGALRALWGSVFTTLSFLTTTGFVSDSWATARGWSGLSTPGLIFVGLVLMGGGVATTAGGVKLLRVYALYKHGTREMGKLIHPHSVAGAGRLGRRIRREGAYIAWVFFMLLVLSICGVMLALSATGLEFEESTILAIAALTTTGPLAQVAGAAPINYFILSDVAKMILAAAMIIGRMETLVLIALFNPSFWRD